MSDSTRPKIHVTPCEGRTVHFPGGAEQLPSIGATVDDAPYWRRLARDKDVVISAPAPKPVKKRDT